MVPDEKNQHHNLFQNQQSVQSHLYNPEQRSHMINSLLMGKSSLMAHYNRAQSFQWSQYENNSFSSVPSNPSNSYRKFHENVQYSSTQQNEFSPNSSANVLSPASSGNLYSTSPSLTSIQSSSLENSQQVHSYEDFSHSHHSFVNNESFNSTHSPSINNLDFYNSENNDVKDYINNFHSSNLQIGGSLNNQSHQFMPNTPYSSYFSPSQPFGNHLDRIRNTQIPPNYSNPNQHHATYHVNEVKEELHNCKSGIELPQSTYSSCDSYSYWPQIKE